MTTHAITFLASAAVIWFFSGILVESTSRIALRFKKSGFAVAFLVLGLLTSIGEISVALNSVINGVPQVSAGNLAGASLVIFLLIIPLLAIFGREIKLEHSLRSRDIAFALTVVVLPALFMADGLVTRKEGFLMVMLYVALLYFVVTEKGIEEAADEIGDEYFGRLKESVVDLTKVLAGAAFIFFASHLLVEEAVYFAGSLGVPASFVGLMLLSIGTNVPEIVIAVRAVVKNRKDVAFGDYLGSAAANTLIMGAMVIGTGRFPIAQQEFVITSVALVIGLVLFYVFSSTERKLTRKEGIILGLVYLAFVAVQIVSIAWLPHNLRG